MLLLSSPFLHDVQTQIHKREKALGSELLPFCPRQSPWKWFDPTIWFASSCVRLNMAMESKQKGITCLHFHEFIATKFHGMFMLKPNQTPLNLHALFWHNSKKDETVGKRFSGYAKVISLCNGLSWFPCFVSVSWRDVRRTRGSACFAIQQIHRECVLLLILNNNNVTISSIS